MSTAAGALVLAACLGTSKAAGPTPLGDGTRILFVGNSLTYVNDVPGILQALADSAGGEQLAVASWALPNYALIDNRTDLEATLTWEDKADGDRRFHSELREYARPARQARNSTRREGSYSSRSTNSAARRAAPR